MVVHDNATGSRHSWLQEPYGAEHLIGFKEIVHQYQARDDLPNGARSLLTVGDAGMIVPRLNPQEITILRDEYAARHLRVKEILFVRGAQETTVRRHRYVDAPKLQCLSHGVRYMLIQLEP